MAVFYMILEMVIYLVEGLYPKENLLRLKEC